MLNPEIVLSHWARGLKPEPLYALKGKYAAACRGLESMAGYSNGLRRNLGEPYRSQISFQQVEEARRKYGGMAVGLTRSRGVAGVMPGAGFELTQKGLAVERRGMRKRMPDAEMENQTPTKLALISQRARREPKCQFTSLVHLLDEGFLRECYYSLGRDRAVGIDEVTWKEYGERLEENLVTRMKAKQYKPKPAKRVYIPKDDKSSLRPLGLPTVVAYCTSCNRTLGMFGMLFLNFGGMTHPIS